MMPAQPAGPALVRPYPAAWATLALQLAEAVPAVLADAATGRLLAACGRQTAIDRRDVQILLAGQIAPKLLQMAAQTSGTAWEQQLRRDVDAFVVTERAGKAALWYQHRGQATPPDAFAGLPWLVGELASTGAQAAQALSACLVPIALLAGTGQARQATALALALAVTVLAGIGSSYVLAEHNRGRELRAAAAHRAVGESRHAFWDNVVPGNAAQRARWQAKYVGAAAAALRQQNEATAMHFGQNTAVQLLGALVLAATVGGSYRRELFAAPQDAGTWLQLLPEARRAAALLGAGGRLCATWQQLGRHLRQYQNKLATLNEQASLEPAALIGAGARVRENGVWRPARSLLGDIPRGPGRSVIDGPGKSGKWMTLLAHKEALGERAVLLPAHHDLMFNTGAGSTGQKARAALQQLARDLEAWPQITHVLLHRWDGNLDDDNETLLGGVVEALSKHWRVIEVRRAGKQAPAQGTET